MALKPQMNAEERRPSAAPVLVRASSLLGTDRGAGPIAGVDEAGRGPLAGPVVAAAVIFLSEGGFEGLADSKKLGPRRCARLAPAIRAATVWALGAASAAEIDRLGVEAAVHLAMRRALLRLPQRPKLALIDGPRVPKGLPFPAQAVIRGDATVAEIAAAAILAKALRDQLMAKLDRRHPGYGWAANKGYPTAAHRAALVRLGPSPHHRRAFAPVEARLSKSQEP